MANMVEEITGLGIDLGGAKTVMVLGDGELVRNELGGHKTATLVSFKHRERLIGEAAVSQVTASPGSTMSAVHRMAGSSYSDWCKSAFTGHLAFKHTKAPEEVGGVVATVEREGGMESFTGTELVAMLLAKLRSCTVAKVGEAKKVDLACLSVPPSAPIAHKRALLDAARVAGFSQAKVFPGPECLCAVYAQKHPVSPESESRTVLMVDMGCLQTTVAMARFKHAPVGGSSNATDEALPLSSANGVGKGKGGGCTEWEVLAWKCSESMGAFDFDQEIFSHFRDVVKTSHGVEVLPGSKQGLRLIGACKRLRELLSTIPAAQTTVENLVDGQDVPLTLNRSELAALCQKYVDMFSGMVEGCLEESGVKMEEVKVAELLGGGCRMPLVQAVLGEMKLEVGSKLDNASLAYGAVLLGERGACSQATEEALVAEGVGMRGEDLVSAEVEERKRQAVDTEMQSVAEKLNSIEALVYDMRGCKDRKHGNLINRERLDTFLDEVEDWLYSDEAEAAGLEEMNDKLTQVMSSLREDVAKSYLEAVDSDKRQMEEQMEAEAKKAEEERKNSPQGEDDHDFRKLPKPERMRMVMKNKEEGNELFAGKNYRMAGARYSKALTHAAKFFDLSEEDAKEVKVVQLSLYLNLAQCYLKMESWDQAINNCGHALDISPESSKALYRRGYAFFAKKDWDGARKDLVKALEVSPSDKSIATLLKKVDAAIKKQTEREKTMWSKAFAS